MAKKAAATTALRRNTKRILAALHASDVAQRTQTLIRDSPPLRVLGLDINTNSTGYAVLSARGRVCEWGHIPTAHLASSDILGIAHAIDTALDGVHSRVAGTDTEPAWVVGIEDFMRMYRFGRFHNKGIFQLAQLNGIVSYTCWQRFRGAPPTHTHPSAARGFFNIAASKKGASAKAGESDIKAQVMAFVQQQQPQLFASTDATEPHEIFARTRTGAYSDAAFDVADAYVVAAFTRWRHFHDQLVHDAALAADFGDAYMALTTAHAAGRKSATQTAEERALANMDAAATRTYLSTLFVHGIDEWIKSAPHELAP